MQPSTVLGVLAELAPAGGDRILDVTRGGKPLVWLDDAERAPRQTEVDRLAGLARPAPRGTGAAPRLGLPGGVPRTGRAGGWWTPSPAGGRATPRRATLEPATLELATLELATLELAAVSRPG